MVDLPRPLASEAPPASAAGPSSAQPGACLWLTGVSGSGKSTLTRALLPRLQAHGRTVTVLDVVPLLAKLPGERTSEGKLLRKAFVAGEIAKHGGIAICVTVSARRHVREQARSIVGNDRFVEVFVDVPREVAAQRREARGRRAPLGRRLRGLVRSAVSRLRRRPPSDYEAPTAPDVTIDALNERPDEGVTAIVQVLIDRGLLLPADRSDPVAEPLEVAEA
jgi:sulfate adenylyltransferase